jgi:hypothetical protein
MISTAANQPVFVKEEKPRPTILASPPSPAEPNVIAKRKREIDPEIGSGRADHRLKAFRCGGYESGCHCKKCLNKWRNREAWNKSPRCIMCPSLCNDAGDGLCGGACKDTLCEVMHGRRLVEYTGSGKLCGYPWNDPAFKKSRHAIARGDVV